MSKKEKLSNIRNAPKRMPLVVYLTIFVFIISCATAAFLSLGYILLINLNIVAELDLIGAGLSLLIGSIVISTSLVRGFGNKIMFRNLVPIIDASKAVANGDFSQRLEVPKEKEMAEICENFNEMVDKLGNNELLARDFISNVSHQFRTPIASIHGYIQLLESDDLTEQERKEYISVVKEKSNSLSKLVNDILQLSVIEHQSAALHKEEFSLDEQLRKCIIDLENEFTAKNIDIELTLAPVIYYGCKELLKEVWNNLIENAIKFSKEGGKIVLILEKKNQTVYVSIKDDGLGMSEETKAHLFDRFYRGVEAYEYPGSGLGMTMIKSILDKHKASINVHSEHGKGSEFVIELPDDANIY